MRIHTTVKPDTNRWIPLPTKHHQAFSTLSLSFGDSAPALWSMRWTRWVAEPNRDVFALFCSSTTSFNAPLRVEIKVFLPNGHKIWEETVVFPKDSGTLAESPSMILQSQKEVKVVLEFEEEKPKDNLFLPLPALAAQLAVSSQTPFAFDVLLHFPSCKRRIWSSEAILSKSPYLKGVLSSDFLEGSRTARSKTFSSESSGHLPCDDSDEEKEKDEALVASTQTVLPPEAPLTGLMPHPLTPVSPKSVYRLAHLLDLPALLSLALVTFRSQLTVSNAAIELFSETAACYDEIGTAVLDSVWVNLAAVKASAGWEEARSRRRTGRRGSGKRGCGRGWRIG
ncbi:hypothetical protein JCM8547_008804 [Rhodosporidiobolus lusitaniae]